MINGRGPVHLDEDDDEEDDQPINQTRAGQVMVGGGGVPSRLSNLSPGSIPTPMGFSPTGATNWGGATPGLSPWPMISPPTPDATFLAAHQQAMMIAKQAYQMAVAQQAIAAAGEQWERGSTMSFGGGGPGSPPFGMSMGGLPVSMGGGWSSAGSMIFPSSSRSLYNGGAAQSEYGGGHGGNWSSSRSVYGEAFGDHRSSRMISPPHNRTSPGYFPPPPPVPQQQEQQSQMQSNRNPRSRAISQPASPNRSGGARRAPPPSSWKASAM